MSNVLVRDIPEATHRELKRRAKASGRSVNAEILLMLDEKTGQEKKVGLGTQIHEFAMRYGGFELDIERDQTPAGLVTFE